MRALLDLLRRTMTDEPRRIFLIDAVGATVSAFLLGVVLFRWQGLVGIPVSALYVLTAIPCLFVLYDVLCYLVVGESWYRYLRGIAIANMIYCIFSLVMARYHIEVILFLGWVYILIEILIVGYIAIAEYQISRDHI